LKAPLSGVNPGAGFGLADPAALAKRKAVKTEAARIR
jgi:hypothetical protein